MNYIKLLREELEKEKSVPDEGKTAEDGMIISKTCLYHYAPNDVIPLIKKNGLFSEEKLVENDPEKKEMLCKRYTPLLQDKYNLYPM